MEHRNTATKRTNRCRMALTAVAITILAAACGSGDGNPTGLDSTQSATGIGAEERTAQPIALAEPPVEQFCSAGVRLAAAHRGGVEQFLVPQTELEQAFADLFSAQQTMLGWGPPELKPDLEAIGDGVFDVKKVFFDHGYDAEAVTSSASSEELAVLRGFTDGDLGDRFDRVVATWDQACDGDRPAAAESGAPDAMAAPGTSQALDPDGDTGSNSPATSTPTTSPSNTSTPTTATPATVTPSTADPGSAAGDPAFCAQDAKLMSTMSLVSVLGRGTDRFAFGDAHTEFYRAITPWRSDDPELFDATFTVREYLIELGKVFPATGELPTVADAFDDVWNEPAWVEARTEIDQWLSANCNYTTGTIPTDNGGSNDQPTAQEALSEAGAESILRGQDDLSELVDTVAGARCIAEGAVADIGVDRYDAAYGVNVRSLAENLTLLGVGYDLIDAEAVAATIETCVELEPVLRRVMTANEVSASVQDCVVADGGVELLTEMIEAELALDDERLDRMAAAMNELAAQCGG